MLQDKFNLAGKKALITGSGQGIGKAIALGLAEYGADVMIHYNRDHFKAESVVRQIRDMGVRTGMIAGDLSERKSTEIIYDATLNTIGEPDILILNASVQIRKYWMDVTEEDLLKQVNVNLASTLWLMQRFVPSMKAQRWGRVITIGSVQQNKPNPQMVVYAATKMALVNVVKSLAPELGQFGITINNVAPGVIATNRNENVLADADYHNKILSKIPLGFIGEPVDCAGMVLLLCSEAGRYITATDILVDGGMSLPV